MHLFLGFTLLLAALIFASANPVSRKESPPKIIEEEDSNDPPAPDHDQDAAAPKHETPPKMVEEEDSNDPPAPDHDQDAAPHNKHDSVLDHAVERDNQPRDEDDDMLVKRRPYVNFKWTKNGQIVEIPYTISGISDKENVLTRAMEVFKEKTCIRFVARGSQADYVAFRSGSSCYAMVGFQKNGQQTVDLTSSCAGRKGKVMHEIMHVLGFVHEQCRPDRNNYIHVNYNNIKSGASTNFDIDNESANQGLPYDCDSILHYKSNAFSTNKASLQTITSSRCKHLGNDDTRLSLLDYQRVNKLYSCGMPTYKYYKVQVTTKPGSYWPTSDDFGTGTDCYIYLKLHGSAHISEEFELDSESPTANPFESGSVDTFDHMAYRNDLGSISELILRMVEHGSAPAWKPSKIVITDPATGQSVTFTNDKWISPSSGEVKIK